MAEITTLQKLIDQDAVVSLGSLQEEENDLLKDIQSKLKALGLYTGDIDGLYGRRTESALIRFCDRVFLDNMTTQLFGPNFAKKLLEAKPDDFADADPGEVTGNFIRPTEGRITSEFGERIHPITGKRKLHAGIDIGGLQGRSVKASDGGKVINARVVSGYGNYVQIEHRNSLISAYAHLNRIDVKVGQSVAQGQQIGLMGATGNVTGPHLHFEIYRNLTPENPRNFINF